MARLICKKCGEKTELRYKEKGGDFSDGGGALLIKGRLRPGGPWLCDHCDGPTALKAGDYAYLLIFMTKYHVEKFADAIDAAETWAVPLYEQYDFWPAQDCFRLRDFKVNSRNQITVYSLEWLEGFSCNHLMTPLPKDDGWPTFGQFDDSDDSED